MVALAEIGDKTQLLALLLATKFKRPWPIVLGILVATLANHAFASAVGAWLVGLIGAHTLRWILGLSFIAMALWTLIPDSAPEEQSAGTRRISASPANTTGTLASIMPSVVPMTTNARSWNCAARATVAICVLSPISASATTPVETRNASKCRAQCW